jgi:hypothetical protein
VTKPHIQIILGSTRDQRLGPPIARWFAVIAAEREDITSELLDLAEFDLLFLSGATPPMTSELPGLSPRPAQGRLDGASVGTSGRGGRRTTITGSPDRGRRRASPRCERRRCPS